ncbi:MAG: hypothetical protein ACI4UV_13240 [Victivallales bacterium]
MFRRNETGIFTKTVSLLRKWRRHCAGDCGVAMLEYALLLASLVILLGAFAPGSHIYQVLSNDMQLRLWLISMPIL